MSSPSCGRDGWTPARLAHGNELSMADAFILEAALAHGASHLYTSDTDFKRYEGKIDLVLI